ncbi:MAG: CoA transferase [Actinomycetota bacterium]|nr:CoA transferase [Actinomycetota bacterium]
MVAPLEGVRVLEIANWAAAPSAGAIMADLGADVVKVEAPQGDSMRGALRQPHQADPGAPTIDYVFGAINRGKRSIAVALDHPEGPALVRRLAGGVDIVVTNLTRARQQRYGLTPDELRDANPRLVVACLSGYGPDGPDADRQGFDMTSFFARGGVMSLLGEPDEPPVRFRPGQGDQTTSLNLLAAVLCALRVRDQTGEGQTVHVSLLQTALWTLTVDLSAALVDRRQPPRRTRADSPSPLTTTYRTADDRWLILSAPFPRQWPAFCHAVGRPEWAEDERYATPMDRYVHRETLIPLIEERFASATLAEWATRLDEHGVTWGPVATLPEVVDDPQVRALGAFAEIDDPVVGPHETVATPFRIDGADVAPGGPAPVAGAHTAEVLADAGFGPDELEELRTRGIVAIGDETAGRPPA